ncbi:interleukin-31 receptor subunit alpha-like protein [Columba livia]|nr:interleukin-31 receptor subunit alpha-like protein [Columba livia]
MCQNPASVAPAQATTVTPDTSQMLESTRFVFADWDSELVCYKELSEDLTCIWLPLPSAPNTINYTVFLKWDRIPKLFQQNTSSSYITIERKNLYMKRSASIWIVVNYPHGSCVKGKNISVTPSKAGKCLTASNINAYQITNRLIIDWALPATPTPYELRYREAFTESTRWTLVPVESNAVNVTILNVNATSSYIVQLRCIAKDGLHCVCIWSKEILVPHKLMNKPRISYNATTEISPGRRSVLLKWEVTQSENILGYYISVERTPNSCRDSPNRLFQKDRKVLLNLSMAYYTVNISAYNKAGESPQAIYVVPDFYARDLPGQIHVKKQGTDAVVTWIPEYNPKCFVVDWGTGKEDMRMKIITTATGNFTLDLNYASQNNSACIPLPDMQGRLYSLLIPDTDFSSLNKGEFEGFVTGLCFSMLFILVFAPLTCSLALKRTSINFHTPDQEFLACSIPFFHLNIDKELTNWKPVSRSLLQALSDNDTISLYVIEHESKTSLKLDLFTDSGEDSKCDTYQSEEPSNNVDVSLRHEGILEEAVTSEEGTISTTIPLLSDYTSMEFSQKTLVGQTVKSPARTAHPHLEMELSNKPAQRKSQVWFGPQDYLKQSQVVFLPSGPTLMGQANSN